MLQRVEIFTTEADVAWFALRLQQNISLCKHIAIAASMPLRWDFSAWDATRWTILQLDAFILAAITLGSSQRRPVTLDH